MPAAALFEKIPQCGRCLAPADRIGLITDGILLHIISAIGVKLCHQLHILSQYICRIASGSNNHAFLKRPNAPEIMRFPLKLSNRILEARKERSYSITCMLARKFQGR